MHRALIVLSLAAATAACGSATASTDSPAPPAAQVQERTPNRFMARDPETRQRIDAKRDGITCAKPTSSVPC